MTDIVVRLHAATLDKDNFPRMDSERAVPVGLAKEAKAEIERLREENANLRRWKALDKPLTAAMAIADSHLKQALRALEPKP